MHQMNTAGTATLPAPIGSTFTDLVVTATAEIDKSDILAVALSEFEDRVQREIERADREIAALRKEIEADQKRLDESSRILVTARHEEAIQMLGRAYGLWKKSFAYELVTKTDRQKRVIEATFTFYSAKVKTQGRYVGAPEHFQHSDLLTFPVEIEFGQEQQLIDWHLRKKEERLAELEEEAVQWRRRLAGMGRVERKVRARLARATLQTSQQGQEVLAAILDHFEELVGLPTE